jgi:4-aminobutyrate aminotransferase-like enzyme
MWGYQRHGFSPDIAVMGKPMGNGLPIAGIAIRSEVLKRFGQDTRYFNTFGGNSVSIAAAAATLSVLQDEGLVENARVVGTELRSRLEKVTAGRPYVADVRGVGFYIGIDLVEPGNSPSADLATFVVNAMRDRQVLISATGVRGETLKIRPPLPFGMANVDRFIEAFESSLYALDAAF